ncbi:MAG: NfeD family protein [Myxococcaceae bacterium]|nr:NfeD family protein [Myxococcaceae bacterium]
MDPSSITWLWAGVGAVLLASELFLPGLVAAFLGAGALTVALARVLGLVESLPTSLALWGVSSATYVLLLRSTLVKYFGAGDRTQASTSEDARAYGAIVEVIEDIQGDDRAGRIRWDGTTWPATSMGVAIPRGARARLVLRDNLAWVVEPAPDDAPLSRPEPAALPSHTRVG